MIGERIRQARMAAGFTLDFLVDSLKDIGVEITKAALSNYEKNKRVPKARFLIYLGKILSVKSSYFMMDSPVKVSWEGYRKNNKLSIRKQEEIEAFSKTTLEKQLFIEDALAYQHPKNFPQKFSISTPDSADKAAEGLRKLWEMGNAPIESVVHTLEAHGVSVIEIPFESKGPKFDGLSGFANRYIPVVVVNTSNPVDRTRFNLCHELGHLLIDSVQFSYKEEEVLANRFSGAFLLPKESLFAEVGKKRSKVSIKELALLKYKYGLSMQAIAYRLADLSVITQSSFRSLCIFFGKSGWRTEEPYPLKMHEKPTRLHQMTLRALMEGIISKKEAEDICPKAVEDLPSDKNSPLSPIELLKLSPQQREQVLEKILVSMI